MNRKDSSEMEKALVNKVTGALSDAGISFEVHDSGSITVPLGDKLAAFKAIKAMKKSTPK